MTSSVIITSTMGVAGIPKAEELPLKIDSGSESPFRTIFMQAYKRIWSGNTLWIIETIFWCIAAAYVGLVFFDLNSRVIDGFAGLLCKYGLPVITPLIILTAIYKSQVNVGAGDSYLKGVPLKGRQILGPRFLAILLTWIQFSLPFLVILPLHLFSIARGLSDLLDNPMLRFAFDYIFLQWFYARNYGFTFSPYEFKDWFFLAILACQAASWGLLPISWGLMWAVNLQRRIGPFVFAYILYILMPAGLFMLINRNSLALDFTNPV
ncbi:hypothetical protein KAU08_01625, partial [bacterium]|nr:hypothetical protein [bacterium]